MKYVALQGENMTRKQIKGTINADFYILLIVSLLLLAALQINAVPVLAAYPYEKEISSQLIIAENQNEMISGTKITISSSLPSGIPAIVVKSGGTLTLKDSLADLSNLSSHSFITVEEGASFIIDHSEISGVKAMLSDALITSNGGNIQIINQSSLKNNHLTGFDKPMVRMSDGTFTIDNSFITGNQLGYSTTGYVENACKGILEFERTKITIKDSRITENNYYFVPFIWVINSEVFDWTASLFSNPKDTDAYYGDITAEGSNIRVTQDSKFINNSLWVFDIYNSELKIDDGVTFENNCRAIDSYGSDVTIGKAVFTNHRDHAINFVNGGRLTINGASFRNNRGNFGGAIEVDTWTRNREEEVEGESYVFDIPPVTYLTINDAEFLNNTAEQKGGAISLGGHYDLTLGLGRYLFSNPVWFVDYDIEENKSYFPPMTLDEYRNLVQADIHKAVFDGNSVIDEMNFPDPNAARNAVLGDSAGAIYVGVYAHLMMNDALITGNTADGSGAGIASGPEAETHIYPRNGAAVFGNKSLYMKDDPADIFIRDNDSVFSISEKMFNNNSHNWDQKENVKEKLVFYDPWARYMEFNLTGTKYSAAPDSSDIDNARVIIKNNFTGTVERTWSSLFDNVYASGAGIFNAGLLEIGQPGTTLNITKIWNDPVRFNEGNAEAFLNSLRFFAGDHLYNTGKITCAETLNAGDGNYFSCKAGSDIYVDIEVFESNENEWTISVKDLPKLEDGQQIVWSIREEDPKYDAEISGSLEEGFTIINTLKPEEPGQTWYRIFDNMTVLPKTGFSALHPQPLAAEPMNISCKPSGLTLQIPSIAVSAEILTVPMYNGNYPVELLNDNAGLLEGSSLPGQGVSIITGHNHLSSTESGPFALLSELNPGDMLFVLDRANQLHSFSIYASEKIMETDVDTVQRLAEMADDALILITCEDERIEGGYANRRIIAAAPL